jgi:curved DNA-binding protein CbpA
MDPYKVLQVDPEAEDEVIEAAYRRLARKYHPDVSPSRESQDRMVLLNQAWEQLRDPTRRAAVDRARTRAVGSAARVASADAQARAAGQPPATATHRGTPGPDLRRRGSGQAAAPAHAPATGAPGWGFSGISEQQPTGGFPSSPSSSSSTSGTSGTAASSASAPWAAGRSMAGNYETRPLHQGEGTAGPPPGNPSGSVVTFGRFNGWSLGEIARVEPEYLEWLDRMPIGRMYQAEIDALLRAYGVRSSPIDAAPHPKGLFRRR